MWSKAQIWDEWGELTRLLWSTRIAFQAEIARWERSYIAAPETVEVKFQAAGGIYQTSLENHIRAVEDSSAFCNIVLLRSYALLERHARAVRHAAASGNWTLLFADDLDPSCLEEIAAVTLSGGVDAWGSELLALVGQEWLQVYGGKGGLVEVSIVRNALAHGHHVATRRHREIAENRGSTFPFDAGEEIKVDFDRLHEYRGRIRSYCRVLSDGCYHLMAGTHRAVNEPPV